MKFFKRVPVFTIRIVYKSGYTHDFECTAFYTTGLGNSITYKWESYSHANKPLMMGVDEIAAIYQVGYRHIWSWR